MKQKTLFVAATAAEAKALSSPDTQPREEAVLLEGGWRTKHDDLLRANGILRSQLQECQEARRKALATPAPSPAGGDVVWAMETQTEHIARDIREGRFPERSERQPALFVASDGSLSADWVAMILAEYGRVEDGQIANSPYLAVMIAEAVDRMLAALSSTSAGTGALLHAFEDKGNGDCAICSEDQDHPKHTLVRK